MNDDSLVYSWWRAQAAMVGIVVRMSSVLCRLLEGALGQGTGICDSAVYTQALSGLLQQVISGSERAATAAHCFVRTRIAGPQLTQLPAGILSAVLYSVAKTVRCVVLVSDYV